MQSPEAASWTRGAREECWAFSLRLSYVKGDIDILRRAADTVSHDGTVTGPELHMIKGFIAYSDGDYRTAYGHFEDGLCDTLDLSPHFANYQRMRFHLKSAKCCWRWDDLPRAAAHIALSLHYADLYHRCQPETARYKDYYVGRILTVYPRLINQQGESGLIKTRNEQEARSYLSQALRYYQENCPLKRFDGSPQQHLFEAEIEELLAVSFRNEGIRSGDAEGRAASWKSFNMHWSKAVSILEHEFSDGKNRRIAHLYRIRGFARIRFVQEDARVGRFSEDCQERCKEAIDDFEEELKTRDKVFQDKNHPTFCRSYNNVALCEILKAHGFLNEHDSDAALSCLKSAEEKLHKANNQNHVDFGEWKQKTSAPRSVPQLFTNISLRMEVILRRCEIEKSFKLSDYHKIESCYLACVKAENDYLQQLNSVEAREYVGRRTHPIYESMLDACYQAFKLKEISLEQRKELNNRCLEIFERGVAMRSYHARLPNTEDPAENKVAYYETKIHQMIRWVRENILPEIEVSKADLGTDEIEFLEHCCQSIKDSFADRQPQQVETYAEVFTHEAGALSMQFSGYADVYFFVLYADEKGELKDGYPVLVRTTPDKQGYKVVGEIKKRGRRLLRNYDSFQRDDVKMSGTEDESDRLSEDELDAMAREIKEDLSYLYDRLVQPIWRLPEIEDVKRMYLICDGWGWDIPWGALLKPGENGLRDFLVKDVLITQQGSLSLWQNQVEYEEFDIMLRDAFVVSAYSVTEVDWQNSAFKKTLDEFRQKYRGRSASNTSGFSFGTNKQERDRGYRFNSRDQRLSVDHLLKNLPKGNVFIFLGHGELTGEANRSVGLVIRRFGDGEITAEYLTQDQLSGLHLTDMQLALLFNCEGGLGTGTTGSVPNSVANTLLRAGVKNVIFSTLAVTYGTFHEFGMEFLTSLERGNSLGYAYHQALLSLIGEEPNERDRMLRTAHWATLRFIGNQKGHFRRPRGTRR